MLLESKSKKDVKMAMSFIRANVESKARAGNVGWSTVVEQRLQEPLQARPA